VGGGGGQRGGGGGGRGVGGGGGGGVEGTAMEARVAEAGVVATASLED
jgi:hypothetical protein